MKRNEREMVAEVAVEQKAEERFRARTPRVSLLREAVEDLLQVERHQERRRRLETLDSSLFRMTDIGVDIPAREMPGWWAVLRRGPEACDCGRTRDAYRCLWHDPDSTLGEGWRAR